MRWKEWGERGGNFFPEGQIEISYSWGLSFVSNNEDDDYGLFQDLLRVFYIDHRKIKMEGDSCILICYIKVSFGIDDLRISILLNRIYVLLYKFDGFEVFHVLI